MRDESEASRLQILQHSLGLDQFGRGNMYRNRFITGEGSIDYPHCMALVERGLMERRGFSALTGGDWFFEVTEAGKTFVLEHSPKLTAKQRLRDRYNRWLDLSDVMPDLTFRDFLVRKIRAAAAELGRNLEITERDRTDGR